MDVGMDTGDMILKQEVEIGEDETTGELWEKLSKVGAKLLVKTLEQIENGTAKGEKQGEDFMITTTTPSVEGKRIVEYKGIVFGEVVSGVNFVRDIAASFSNFFGGRSGSYEEELIAARQNALAEMEQRALQVGANAVVGVDIDYEVLGADNGMLMVTASGTAVYVE